MMMIYQSIQPYKTFKSQHNNQFETLNFRTCLPINACYSQPAFLLTAQIYDAIIWEGLAGRIQWLHLCRRVKHPQTSVLDMTLNNLMVRFQLCYCFEECRVDLYNHYSLVHSDPEEQHLIGFYLWVKLNWNVFSCYTEILEIELLCPLICVLIKKWIAWDKTVLTFKLRTAF